MAKPWELAIVTSKEPYPRKSWGERKARQRREREARNESPIPRPEADIPPLPLKEYWENCDDRTEH